ncbi:MAG: hypothetical protein QW197_01550 [Candidatus Aenigmatarchaeota archaeon]
MKRGVSEILSFILIALLVVSLISLILSWGIPYLQKRQDEMKVNIIYQTLFNDLSESSVQAALRRILIAKSGSERVGGYDGSWNVTQNTITFSFSSKVSPVSPGNWVAIYGCLKDVCEFPKEPFYVVEVYSEKVQDVYRVSYRLRLKRISVEGDTYTLFFSQPFYSNSKYIFISFDRIDYQNKVISFKVS